LVSEFQEGLGDWRWTEKSKQTETNKQTNRNNKWSILPSWSLLFMSSHMWYMNEDAPELLLWLMSAEQIYLWGVLHTGAACLSKSPP
jgi:hypothetical protein